MVYLLMRGVGFVDVVRMAENVDVWWRRVVMREGELKALG